MNRNSGLKQADRQMVRRCFYHQEVLDKAALQAETGLSAGAVTGILQDLLEKGEILRINDADSTGGRRKKQYSLNGEYAHIGMIACRRHHDDYIIEQMIQNLNGKLLFQDILHSDKGNLQAMEHSIRKIADYDKSIHAVVISIPGVSQQGKVRLCDFHELEGKDLGQCIPHDLEWVVENDVNTACIGFAHEHPEMKDMALVYQPDEEYTGCGIMIGGRLYNGADHMAGEMRFLPDEKPAAELKDPALSLWKEIRALRAVLDPQMIGWSSQLVHKEDLDRFDWQGIHLKYIEDMQSFVWKGLFEIGKELLLEGENGDEGRLPYSL